MLLDNAKAGKDNARLLLLEAAPNANVALLEKIKNIELRRDIWHKVGQTISLKCMLLVNFNLHCTIRPITNLDSS